MGGRLYQSQNLAASVDLIQQDRLKLLFARASVSRPIITDPFVTPEHLLTPIVAEIHYRLHMSKCRRLRTIRMTEQR